jgi:hypothetical protein
MAGPDRRRAERELPVVGLKNYPVRKARANRVLEAPVQQWREFEGRIRQIEDSFSRAFGKFQERLTPLLYRGLGSSKYKLHTTLERHEANTSTDTLGSYYTSAYEANPHIEALTGNTWQDLPDPIEFQVRLHRCEEGPVGLFRQRENRRVWEYFSYLRHHGFPSPLMDWTESPYIAAFFAFENMEPTATFVSIWVLAQTLDERDERVRSSPGTAMVMLTPHMKSHRRHILQQSHYSMCLNWKEPDSYGFVEHRATLRSVDHTRLFHITIPASERLTALRTLDQMNINAFSLFASEDSLMRTLANRHLLLPDSSPWRQAINQKPRPRLPASSAEAERWWRELGESDILTTRGKRKPSAT